MAWCPGVPWLRIQELAGRPYLATATMLGRAKHKAVTEPVACYFSATQERYVLLYDVRDAIPLRPLSPRQRAALDRARQQAQMALRCSWCGRQQRRKAALEGMADGHTLCVDCARRWRVSATVREWFAQAERVVILDTETTGLDPWGGGGDRVSDGEGDQDGEGERKGDEIVEIAVLGLDGTPRLNTLVRPTRHIHIPAAAVAIHGITDAMVQNAPTFAEVLPRLAAAIAGCQVLIYNAAFDRAMLQAACARLPGILRCPVSRKRTSCVMQLYAEYVGEWSSIWEDYRWQPLPGGDHRALGDCQAVLDLLHTLADVAPLSALPVIGFEG